MPRQYSESTKKIVDQAKQFVAKKRQQGWGRKHFAQALKMMFDAGPREVDGLNLDLDSVDKALNVHDNP